MTLNELAHLSNELLAELDTFFVMLSAEEPPSDEDLRAVIEDVILAAEEVKANPRLKTVFVGKDGH